MKRGPYPKVAERNRRLVRLIRSVKADHPFWGYRRVWAYLRFTRQLCVGRNRVHRLMAAHNLLVTAKTRLRAKRKALRPKPRPERVNQWWGIDMTKVRTGGGWVYATVVLDWRTKKIVGHHAGQRSTSAHWLQALDRAVNRQFPHGVRGSRLHLMSDNGCQPTSVRFMKSCRTMGISQAFTSYNNPKGNADTERFMRTLKEELAWINEWDTPQAFIAAFGEWIDEYNANYRHSALGYRTPMEFEQLELGHELPLERAC